MTDEYKSYLYLKLFLSIIHDDKMIDDINNKHYVNYIMDPDFVETFNYLTIEFAKNNILTDEAKERIFRLISYFRFNVKYKDKEAKSYYYKMFNEMISALNCSNGENSDEYYYLETIKRYEIKSALRMEKFMQLKDFVEYSISFDFYILEAFSDRLSDKTFKEEIHKLVNNKIFFLSLNAILCEYPDLLSQDIFKNRLKILLELNKGDKLLLSKNDLETKAFVLKNNFKYKKYIN